MVNFSILSLKTQRKIYCLKYNKNVRLKRPLRPEVLEWRRIKPWIISTFYSKYILLYICTTVQCIWVKGAIVVSITVQKSSIEPFKVGLLRYALFMLFL